MRFPALAEGPADGELVLLLHGFPQTSLAWSAQVQALGDAGWLAVAPDIRGFAPTARPQQVADYAQDLVAADVLAIASRLGADSFHLVGHDLGGIIAWDVACRHPARIRTLTAASTPHLMPFVTALRDKEEQRVPPFDLFRQPEAAELAMLGYDAAGLRAGYAGLDLRLIDEYVGIFSQPGALTAGLNHFRAFNFEDWLALPPAEVPTLFTWGAEDPYLARATALASRCHVTAPYTEIELDDVAHWLPELAANAVTDLMIAHLRAYR
jgi:pimeloyl-ACP methyl ester carboxylesterase